MRGIISTDQNGYYGFESIFPGYYAGRPRHIHYKITSPSGLELITQCYFEVDPLIDGDWEHNHSGLVIPLEETENGLVGEFNIVLNEEVSAVSVDSKPFSLPKRFSLDIVYPNPFNNSIKIDFTINNFGYVDIGIYDITGKWVSNLIGKSLHSGKYNIVWKGGYGRKCSCIRPLFSNDEIWRFNSNKKNKVNKVIHIEISISHIYKIFCS